jgi:hypothetical protein
MPRQEFQDGMNVDVEESERDMNVDVDVPMDARQALETCCPNSVTPSGGRRAAGVRGGANAEADSDSQSLSPQACLTNCSALDDIALGYESGSEVTVC